MVRVNVFKVMGEKPADVFGRWKDAVRFVGEIGDGASLRSRLFTTNPDDMAKVLALNLRKMRFGKAELVSDIKGARKEGIEGRLSTIAPSESEPIFSALAAELGTGNVVDKTAR